jgi:hypothetical protein
VLFCTSLLPETRSWGNCMPLKWNSSSICSTCRNTWSAPAFSFSGAHTNTVANKHDQIAAKWLSPHTATTSPGHGHGARQATAHGDYRGAPLRSCTPSTLTLHFPKGLDFVCVPWASCRR